MPWSSGPYSSASGLGFVVVSAPSPAEGPAPGWPPSPAPSNSFLSSDSLLTLGWI
jgi:hypothetical protein